MSTRTSPSKTNPYSAPRRATCAAYALATIVFVGIHPVLTHVPPNLWRSIIATVLPAPANLAAKDGPAWPVPMMMASNFLIAAVLHPIAHAPCIPRTRQATPRRVDQYALRAGHARAR